MASQCWRISPEAQNARKPHLKHTWKWEVLWKTMTFFWVKKVIPSDKAFSLCSSLGLVQWNTFTPIWPFPLIQRIFLESSCLYWPRLHAPSHSLQRHQSLIPWIIISSVPCISFQSLVIRESFESKLHETFWITSFYGYRHLTLACFVGNDVSEGVASRDISEPGPMSEESAKLCSMFGLKKCVVLAPNSYSGRIMNEQATSRPLFSIHLIFKFQATNLGTPSFLVKYNIVSCVYMSNLHLECTLFQVSMFCKLIPIQ